MNDPPLREASLEFRAQHEVDEEGLVVREGAVERRRDVGRVLDPDRVHTLALREPVEAQVRLSEIEAVGKCLVALNRLRGRGVLTDDVRQDSSGRSIASDLSERTRCGVSARQLSLASALHHPKDQGAG